MRDFFSLDGPFSKYGGFLADTLVLSFMWIIFSIPIITIGASTTAMFYVSTRRISEREGYITSDFWFAFKANFGRGTKLWLMVLTVMALLITNLLNRHVIGSMSVVIVPIQIIFLIQVTLISIYLFPLTARFDMGIKQTLKSSFFLANRHFATSITCIAILASLFFASLYLEPLLIIIPGAYAMGSSYFMMKIFKKYRPEMDKDPMLEVQELEAQIAEERRIRNFSSTTEVNKDED